MKYVSPEYAATLYQLAETLAADRRERCAEAAGEVVLAEVIQLPLPGMNGHDPDPIAA